jgi:8-oxo-dGTP pyrophosphatase MutT (NUDIX family)
MRQLPTDSEQPVIAAGMLIITIEQPRQFLLMRHSDRWDLPKGHAEPNETPRQTAIREMVEETGLDANQVRLDEKFEHVIEYHVRYRDGIKRLKRVHYYLGWIDGPQPILCTEHPDSRWFDWEPARPIQSQTIDPLISAVRHYLESDGGDVGQFV